MRPESNFLIFMEFLAILLKIIGWQHPSLVELPPLGNPGSTTESVV